MWKFHLFASLLTLSPLLAVSASARQPDHGCYMQTSSGQLINLSRSVCQFDLGNSAQQDAAYLAAVRNLIEDHAEPWMIEMVANNPGAFTAAAREYCEARRSGITQRQFIERRYQQAMQSQAAAASLRAEADYEQQQRSYQARLMPLSIAMSLAPQYYCAEVEQRRVRQRG